MNGATDGYRIARKNLVRVLETLSGYKRGSVVVVGAQAVYLQIAETTDGPFLPFTLDSDLAVDPRILAPTPPIRRTLENHGYSQRHGDPGLYWAPGSSDDRPLDGAKVDILVPEEFAFGRGRRDAQLPGDNARAARRTAGLESTLYDKNLVPIRDPDSGRVIEAYVAGPAALIIAKAHKIVDRGEERLKAKDASDVFLLLRAFELEELKKRFDVLASATDIERAFAAGIRAVREVFTDSSRGRRLFAESLGGFGDSQQFLDAFELLTDDLAHALAGYAGS